MKLLEYNLGEGTRAFSTYRQGGVSRGLYASFNANLFCGDDPAHVDANRTILAQHLGLDKQRLIIPHQTHGTAVRTVDRDFLDLTPEEQRRSLEGVDALVTDIKEVCLCVSTADCVPVVVYDPERKACACIHAGWRGMYRHIIPQAIQALDAYPTLQENHGRTKDAHPTRRAAIGPCIGLGSFEVGDEVYEAFELAGFDMSRIAARTGGPDSKWHIDLVEAAREECRRNGISDECIQACGIDTFTHTDDFFSARKLGTQSGRILTGIVME